MSSTLTEAPDEAVPCPRCGYDLRGHPDVTRCPECGAAVHVSAAQWRALHWLDHRLLDLWSIAVLQVIGCLALVTAATAVRQGQYFALLLGLLAGLCMITASLWFLALGLMLISSTGRGLVRMIGGPRLQRLWRWCAADAALIVVPPAVLIVLMRAL